MPKIPVGRCDSAQLVLVFAATSVLTKYNPIKQIKAAYPHAIIFGCSTGGEICGTQVLDESLVITAIQFEHTHIQVKQVNLEQVQNSFHAGECLAKMFDPAGLVHVMVLSDGVSVNGSNLVQGLVQHLPGYVTATGGLAADGTSFKKTFVWMNDTVEEKKIAALGFYGSSIRISFGSLGGWVPFGPQRLVTRSKGNILYELDGHSALELYKKYLGEHADGLPATGLLFPLCLRTKTDDIGIVRTILSVNEKEQSLRFAGDIPEGTYTQLMKANFDRLVDGAVGAAKTSCQAQGAKSPDLAVLISCVGRKLVLKQRIEEELEGVRDVFGERTILTGFYSYGEISPFMPGAKCELHNQTMTITTFWEE